MPHLKIVKEKYNTYMDTEVLIHKYVFRHAQNYGYGGLAVDSEYAAKQMEVYRNIYGKTSQYCLLHWILSFSKRESEEFTCAELMSLAYGICEYYCKEYQIVFGIHWQNESWDIHFVMNMVNYQTGYKFPLDYKSQDTLQKICEIETGGKRVGLDVY